MDDHISCVDLGATVASYQASLQTQEYLISRLSKSNPNIKYKCLVIIKVSFICDTNFRLISAYLMICSMFVAPVELISNEILLKMSMRLRNAYVSEHMMIVSPMTYVYMIV